MTITVFLVAIIILLVLVLLLSIKLIGQYERGIVFRLGRLRPVYKPGPHLVIPLLERMERDDTRVVTLAMPPQEDSTEDNRPDAVRPPARGIPTMRRLLRRLRTRRAGALRGPAAGSSDRRTGSKERPVAAPSHTSRQSFLASSLVSSPVALSPLFRGI